MYSSAPLSNSEHNVNLTRIVRAVKLIKLPVNMIAENLCSIFEYKFAREIKQNIAQEKKQCTTKQRHTLEGTEVNMSQWEQAVGWVLNRLT